MQVRRAYWWLLLVALAAFIAGCGTTSGTGGSGYGADAGPWPQRPTQTAANTARPAADDVPSVPLVVQLRGKAADGARLELAVTAVELKYKDQWVPVIGQDAIGKIEKQPVAYPPKGAIGLLATKATKVPRRAYTHVRLRFDDRLTALVTEEQKTATPPKPEKRLPLTLQATLELGEWTPGDKAVNLLTIAVDGAKVTATETSATLPAGALTVAKGAAAAGISGKLIPALPTARVDVLWGNTKLVVGTAVPDAQTGAFQVPDLPAGSYRLEITSPGFRLVEPRKDPIALDDKPVAIGDIQLTKDAEGK